MNEILHMAHDSDQLRITMLNETDIPALDILADIIDPHREFEYFITCFEKHKHGTRDIFGAWRNDLLTGYVMLNYTPRYALYKKLEIPEIQDLRVHPEFRRHGIGRALVQHCEHVAKQKKYNRVGIGVGLNPSFGPAQRLYTKVGYIPDGNGAVYDRKQTTSGELRPLDDQLCLMMIKEL